MDARLGGLGSQESDADDQMAALSELSASIEAVGRAVQVVAGSRARESVTQGRELVSAYYSQLCNPRFDRILIAVEDQRIAGVDRNNYVIRATTSSDGAQTLASSRLSTAQMNCVALSVYLALAAEFEHDIGFVVLDDPSQSRDTDHKKALGELLRDVEWSGPMRQTGTGFQVLIATHDLELDRMLRESWAEEDCN